MGIRSFQRFVYRFPQLARISKTPRCFLAYKPIGEFLYFTAMTLISTLTLLGSVFTATVSLAGKSELK